MTHKSSILFWASAIIVAMLLATPLFLLMLNAACEDLCHRGCLELGWPESEITGTLGRYKCFCIKTDNARLYWDILPKDESG